MIANYSWRSAINHILGGEGGNKQTNNNKKKQVTFEVCSWKGRLVLQFEMLLLFIFEKILLDLVV